MGEVVEGVPHAVEAAVSTAPEPGEKPRQDTVGNVVWGFLGALTAPVAGVAGFVPGAILGRVAAEELNVRAVPRGAPKSPGFDSVLFGIVLAVVIPATVLGAVAVAHRWTSLRTAAWMLCLGLPIPVMMLLVEGVRVRWSVAAGTVSAAVAVTCWAGFLRVIRRLAGGPSAG